MTTRSLPCKWGFGASVLVTLGVLLAPGHWVWAAKLWVASWLPFMEPFEGVGPAGHADKVVHALLFALMGALATWGWAHQRRQRALVLWCVFGLAPLTELLQAWVPGRGSSWMDGVADLLGLALGCVWAAWLGPRVFQGASVSRRPQGVAA